jgi:hypothetical protein
LQAVFSRNGFAFLSPHQIYYVFSIPYKVSLAATVCERAAAFVFEAEATGVVATDCFPINKTLLGFKPD